MIDPTVRRARPGDLFETEQLRALEAEARAALVDQRGGQRWLAENPTIGWSGTASNVWLAHIDDVVVGFIVAEFGDDRIARVLHIWVTPEARELGFGDALLGAVIDDARAARATGIEGAALPGDRHTKNLYERAGIVARLIITYKEL
jgi:ribosomal protein S18 acetylase RimI-like enzyme